MTAIRIEHLTKSYDPTLVLDDVSLEIGSGELFFLLGPSGCGKTTLLRIIAGFVMPDRGEVYFDHRHMNAVPPKDRGTGMVFQNYALWPHMTVAQNVSFGLEVRMTPGPERDQRVAGALALVRLSGLEQHRPTQLSGGQQQRVALARALVIRPAVLLLDEPLSNLDARLRGEMREEIRRIHDETRLTTVYVTHDQKEALSLADRMAVMHHGRIIQVGTPRELYLHPRSRFLAEFLGEANWLSGRVQSVQGEQIEVQTEIGLVVGTATNRLGTGSLAICCIRPESIALSPPTGLGPNRFRAKLMREIFLGEMRHVHLQAGQTALLSYRLQVQSDAAQAGAEIDFSIDPHDVTVLPAEAPGDGGVLNG